MTTNEFSKQAANALQNGRAAEARTLFEKAATQTQSADDWLGAASACQLLGDFEAQLLALEKALEASPKNIDALIDKADLLDRQGEIKSAGSFYGNALTIASQRAPGSITQTQMTKLQRAQSKCQEYQSLYESHLMKALGPVSEETAKSTNGAFNRSLDIMFGRRQPYVQQPQQYFFPELPNIQFYNRNDFDWVADLDAATPVIRGELETLIAASTSFDPYMQINVDAPRTDHLDMFDNPDWSAFFLWKDGKPIPENIAKCPKTAKTVEKLPLASIPGSSPSVLFSLLKPGAKIPPHTGLINTRLICHLPLIIPEGCGFRVGNETREWVEGKTWIFDDTIEHEAWNNSQHSRYVLIFDIEQPAMSQAEHFAVSELFRAMSNFN